MKPVIIVTTDFTDSSKNALDYACAMANGNFDITLLHIYTLPVSHAAEGIVLETMKDEVEDADEQIADEVARIKETYPQLHVEGKVVIGGFMLSLKQYISELRPDVVVMGAKKDYEDLGEWNSGFLDALTTLPVPVLIIPQHIVYAPIQNVGFACDYRKLNDEGQVKFIKQIINNQGAKLHVVHVSRSKQQYNETIQKNEQALQELLKDVAPQYYVIEDPNVIDAIARFIKEHQIDFLIVIPHRHGFWEGLFNQSHTRQLAKLNNLPVLALHD